MNVFCDSDGTWGSSDELVFIDIDGEDADNFGELSDGDRYKVAKMMANDGFSFGVAFCIVRGFHDSGDNPADVNGEALCVDCHTLVNAVPD